MKIEIEDKPGNITIFRLQGKLLIGEGDELLKEKIDEFVQNGRQKIILDLSGVPYMDTCGLAELVRSYTTIARSDGDLRLLKISKRLQDLLSITKLLTVFQIFDDEEEAIASFG